MLYCKNYVPHKCNVYYEDKTLFYEMFSNIFRRVIDIQIDNVLDMIHKHNGYINRFERIVFNNEKNANEFIEELNATLIMNKLLEVK